MLGSYKHLVRSVIEAARIDHRLARFDAIARHFPISAISRLSDRSPYYCHFIEWRLATLDDGTLERFDSLLRSAESMEGWGREGSLLSSNDFAEYWSLIWQLQVAEYLKRRGFELEWLGAGPDLKVSSGNSSFFVECYSPRKNFAAIHFAEEVLRQISTRIRLDHQLFLPLTFPKGRALDLFLSSVVTDVTTRLQELLATSDADYPVVLDLPAEGVNVTIWIEGSDVSAYRPGILPVGGGDVHSYLELVLGEALRNKAEQNRLAVHHPNVLAVNLLQGTDQQLASSWGDLKLLDFPDSIGELAWGTIGIDKAIAEDDMRSIKRDGVVGYWRPSA